MSPNILPRVPRGYADMLGDEVRPATGTRVFGPDELTGALAERGLTAVDRQLAGTAQFVSARFRR
jgi:hypothetical protein